MHWPSLLIGIVLGWIIEWLIDFFFTRKRRQDWADKETDMGVQLANALAENNTLRAQLTAQQEAESVAAEMETRAPEAAGLAAAGLATAGFAAAALSGEGAVVTGDDLTIIEGIGSRTAGLLNQQGIYTFAELADTDVDRLRTMLAEGGPAFRLAAPDTWPRQARLAANHDWVRLQTLKQQLTGGVRKPVKPEQVVDDLTIIEGIGDKTAELLNQQGIYAFADLADTDVDRLRTILAAGGPAFRLAAPETWPRQARLAANRDWVRLQSLKEELTGGVRRPAAPEVRVEAEAETPEGEAISAESPDPAEEEAAWPMPPPEVEAEPPLVEEETSDVGQDDVAEEAGGPEPPPEVEVEPPLVEEETGDQVDWPKILGQDDAAEEAAEPESPPEVEAEPPAREAETGMEGADLAASDREADRPPAEPGA